MVSTNLCKEYLNMATFKIFTPGKVMNILIYETYLPMSPFTGIINFLTQSGF